MFEAQARDYPPVSCGISLSGHSTDTQQLFHAMMALSALSIAHKKGSHNAHALEHYQQVIPALQTTVKSSQDSYVCGHPTRTSWSNMRSSFRIMYLPRCKLSGIDLPCLAK